MRKNAMNFQKIQKNYTNCNLCPRNCGVNRDALQTGVCGVDANLKIARAALHFWEEPCISGDKGSGAVFFSGCSLHCVFCQNHEIANGTVGKVISKERLTEIFLELQEKGANNINLVTPGQYVPHIVYAVESARNQGLSIPIVYNTSSYETTDNIKRLEGIVDVYLPDFKYLNPLYSQKYSHAADYSAVAKEVIKEMVRQHPVPKFYKEEATVKYNENQEWITEAEEGYLIGEGVIVRQLLLPGMLDDAKNITQYLYETYGDQIFISLMSQYTPLKQILPYPELNRKVSEEEYEQFVDYAIELGVEHGFIQEGDVAEESFIPSFDCEGV